MTDRGGVVTEYRGDLQTYHSSPLCSAIAADTETIPVDSVPDEVEVCSRCRSGPEVFR